MATDTVWNIFMKDLVKVKSNEFLSRFDTESDSVPYGKHLVLIKLKITSSEADPRTLPNIQFNDLKKEFFACVKEQLKTRPALK